MTIRSRIVTALLSVLAVALFLVVALSTIFVRDAFYKTLDQTLRTTAQAVSVAMDVRSDNVVPDEGDMQQIARLRGDSHVTVFNNAGKIVDGEIPPAIAQALWNSSGVLDARYQGRAVRVAIEPIRDRGRVAGTVLAWRSPDYIDSAVRDTLIVGVLVALAVLAIGAIVARRVADSVVSPVNSMAGLIERIEHRDLSLRVGSHAGDELGRLRASFDRMLDRLEAAFSRERQFTADASHELRAPLAVLRAEVELALRRPRSEQEYREALVGAMREIERLEMLVDGLLAAARAEVDSRHCEVFDLRSVADDVVERTSTAARAKNIALSAHGDSASIVADPVGIERALTAVVHNAVTNAPENGNVSVQVSHDDAVARVVIRDSGPGFSNTALENAAKRFWRGDDSRPRGGTGLGLSIADAFVRANGGKLELANGPGGGALVTFEFTVSP